LTGTQRERERVNSLCEFDLKFYLPRSVRPLADYYWGTFNNLKRYFYGAFRV